MCGIAGFLNLDGAPAAIGTVSQMAELQRHLARQQYYVQLASSVIIAVWDGALKNYGPNLGYDYGGRLVAAWLDR